MAPRRGLIFLASHLDVLEFSAQFRVWLRQWSNKLRRKIPKSKREAFKAHSKKMVKAYQNGKGEWRVYLAQSKSLKSDFWVRSSSWSNPIVFCWCLSRQLRVGTKYLTQSAAYTPKFGQIVCKLHLKHMEALLWFSICIFLIRVWSEWMAVCILYYVYLLIRYIPYHEHFAAQEKHAGLLRREIYGISEQALKQAGLGLDH